MSTPSLNESDFNIQWYPLICHLPLATSKAEKIAFVKALGISDPTERKIKSDVVWKAVKVIYNKHIGGGEKVEEKVEEKTTLFDALFYTSTESAENVAKQLAYQDPRDLFEDAEDVSEDMLLNLILWSKFPKAKEDEKVERMILTGWILQCRHLQLHLESFDIDVYSMVARYVLSDPIFARQLTNNKSCSFECNYLGGSPPLFILNLFSYGLVYLHGIDLGVNSGMFRQRLTKMQKKVEDAQIPSIQGCHDETKKVVDAILNQFKMYWKQQPKSVQEAFKIEIVSMQHSNCFEDLFSEINDDRLVIPIVYFDQVVAFQRLLRIVGNGNVEFDFDHSEVHSSNHHVVVVVKKK